MLCLPLLPEAEPATAGVSGDVAAEVQILQQAAEACQRLSQSKPGIGSDMLQGFWYCFRMITHLAVQKVAAPTGCQRDGMAANLLMYSSGER